MTILDKNMTVKELGEWMEEREMSAHILLGGDGRFTTIVYPAEEPNKYEAATDEDMVESVINAIGEWENTFYSDDEDGAPVDADSVPPTNEEG